MQKNNTQPVIRVEKITKHFTSTRALNEVSFEVYPGQIRGLIGENGSGKSTLSSIISGNLNADSGEMFFMGKPYKPKDSFDASETGVTMIVQEQGTIPTISAGANIFAGREKQFVKYGFLNSKKLNKEAKKLLLRIGVDHIEPETLAAALSLEDRKLVEIARAFYKLPELFIVDETTTALPQHGRDILHSLMRELRDAGKSVLFISHDMFLAFILGMDTFALGLIKAAEIIEDKRLDSFVKERYASFESGIGADIVAGKTNLAQLAEYAEKLGEPELPGSGRQEQLESVVNSVLFGMTK